MSEEKFCAYCGEIINIGSAQDSEGNFYHMGILGIMLSGKQVPDMPENVEDARKIPEISRACIIYNMYSKGIREVCFYHKMNPSRN